jgi:protein involved in polysaccharide export with SLBB domain
MRPISLSLSLALLLGGCLSQPNDTASVPAARADVLKPGDSVIITVAGEDELSGLFIINSEGALQLQMLGKVPAAGLSPVALQERLRQSLAAGYLKNPQVVVARVAGPAPALPPPVLRQSEAGQ